MLMKEGEALGVVVDALCLGLVGKKQFKMTAMDIAGNFCLCKQLFCPRDFVFATLPSTREFAPLVSSSDPSSRCRPRLNFANNTDMLTDFSAKAGAWL